MDMLPTALVSVQCVSLTVADVVMFYHHNLPSVTDITQHYSAIRPTHYHDKILTQGQQ